MKPKSFFYPFIVRDAKSLEIFNVALEDPKKPILFLRFFIQKTAEPEVARTASKVRSKIGEAVELTDDERRRIEKLATLNPSLFRVRKAVYNEEHRACPPPPYDERAIEEIVTRLERKTLIVDETPDERKARLEAEKAANPPTRKLLKAPESVVQFDAYKDNVEVIRFQVSAC